MSKGLGKVERAVLQALTEMKQPLCGNQLAWMVFGHGYVEASEAWRTYIWVPNHHLPAAELVSVRRAARSLTVKTGLIGMMKIGAFFECERPRKMTIPAWALKSICEEEERREKRYWEKSYRSLVDRAAAELDSATRRKLAKVLGMLGSAHEGERMAAATMAEERRKQLGQDWARLPR